MTLQERIDAVVQKAREYDRKANSGDSECRECDWREAYCLTEIAYRAQAMANEADWNELMGKSLGHHERTTQMGSARLREEAEALIAGLLE